MTKILVTGATGQLGQLAIAALEQRTAKENLAVLVRSDAAKEDFATRGFDARQGDYSDADSLNNAFDGIEKVLFISGSEIGQRVAQHQNVVTAAAAAGVKHIAYTSLLKAQDNPIVLAPEHKATEDAIAASGMDYTLLRNGWYSENFMMALPQILEMGQHFGAAGAGKFSPATRADMAEAAAVVLTTDGHAQKTYEIAGDESFDYAAFAQMVSDASGKAIAYVDMPAPAYKEALLGAGLPEPMAALLAQADEQAATGWLFDDSGDLAKLIGRPTTPLKDVITTALSTAA